MTPRRELKKYAKEAMSGKYGTIILGFVAVQALADNQQYGIFVLISRNGKT